MILLSIGIYFLTLLEAATFGHLSLILLEDEMQQNVECVYRCPENLK